MKLKILFTLFILFSVFVRAEVLNSTVPDKVKTFPLEVLQLSDDPNIKAATMVADKSERKLYFFNPNDTELNSPEAFEIDIGKNDGNKTKRNDKKTPEGIYLLEKKMLPPEIPFELYGSMAFTTNYPNVFDKFENKSGSGIWLHSVPDTVPLSRGSKGCVVLRNDKLKKLSDFISLNKSHLIINDRTNWITEEQHSDQKNKIITWVENWKNLWTTQDFRKYIELYSEDFSAPGFNKDTWLKHKEKLKTAYTQVSIDLSKPSIFHIKNQYLLKFVQNYKSDGHQDTGIKTLYLLEENNSLKILREEWAAL